SAQAEAGGPEAPGLGRALLDLRDAQERLRPDGRVVARALSAVGAVLRAAAGLDAQQGTALDVPEVVVSPVDLGGPRDQLQQRLLVDGLQFVDRLHGGWVYV